MSKSSNLVGTKRFGSGWEQIADAAEEPPVTVLRKPPAPSNVYVKTNNESGFLRAAAEPQKFDPSALDAPKAPARRVAPAIAKVPSVGAAKRAPPHRVPEPKAPEPKRPSTHHVGPRGGKERDPVRHREYMREYMRRRRLKKLAAQPSP